MITLTRLVALKLFGGTFQLLWIAASIVAIYFLYQALAHDAPWIFVFWSVVAGLMARRIAASISDAIQGLEYVEQLLDRGHVRVDAEAAWRTTKNGGMNLLANLRRVELANEIDRLESELENPNAEDTRD